MPPSEDCEFTSWPACGAPADAYLNSLDELLAAVLQSSPEVKSREKMAAAAEVRVKMAKKEYYPDFTLSAEYDKKGGPFMDMWVLKTSVNVPLYYKTKQRQAVYEMESSLSEARNELSAARLMVSSSVRDNYSMLRTAERLMELYKNGLMSKTNQDFESALTGYMTGKTEAITVISRLKALIDYETAFWDSLPRGKRR